MNPRGRERERDRDRETDRQRETERREREKISLFSPVYYFRDHLQPASYPSERGLDRVPFYVNPGQHVPTDV